MIFRFPDPNNPYSPGTYGNSKVIGKKSKQNAHSFSVTAGTVGISATQTISNTKTFGFT
jgi:hypothetical protein